jgi:hypothetical protein
MTDVDDSEAASLSESVENVAARGVGTPSN